MKQILLAMMLAVVFSGCSGDSGRCRHKWSEWRNYGAWDQEIRACSKCEELEMRTKK
jgi:hypothetical protein